MRGDLNVDQSDAVLIEKLAFIFGYQNFNVYDGTVCEYKFNWVLEFDSIWITFCDTLYKNGIKKCYAISLINS